LKSNALWTFFWASFCGRIFLGGMVGGGLYPDLWRVEFSVAVRPNDTEGSQEVTGLIMWNSRGLDPAWLWPPPAQPCSWAWSRLRAGEPPTFGGQQYLNIRNILWFSLQFPTEDWVRSPGYSLTMQTSGPEREPQFRNARARSLRAVTGTDNNGKAHVAVTVNPNIGWYGSAQGARTSRWRGSTPINLVRK